MKPMIVYASMTGHSKKLANAMARKLGIAAHSLRENPTIADCSILFIVSGIYAGACKPELLKFAQGLNPQQVKKVALVTSSAKKVPQTAIREALAAKGVEVLKEEYLCIGGFLFMGASHPNQEEVQGAAAFAQKYAKA